MKSLYFVICPICKGSFDYRNMKGGTCRECNDKIDMGDEDTLKRYHSLPLDEITNSLITIEKIRVGGK